MLCVCPASAAVTPAVHTSGGRTLGQPAESAGGHSWWPAVRGGGGRAGGGGLLVQPTHTAQHGSRKQGMWWG